MTTFHDQIKDKQPVAKFEQQTRSDECDTFSSLQT